MGNKYTEAQKKATLKYKEDKVVQYFDKNTQVFWKKSVCYWNWYRSEKL